MMMTEGKQSNRNPWVTLTVLALAQFVVILDLTIVNVALPHIQRDLHFSADGLQWIVNAYTLMFGGFLLLGGRAADLLGRRALFIAGLALFTGASFMAGIAQSSTMMIVARAIQGLGGAMLSPAALSLVTVTFPHGRERNIAMGIWGALAGLGGTLGVILGGVLVTGISWRAVFFVNVPIGIALITLAPLLIAESRVAATEAARGFDIPGAVLGTGGLLGVVFGIVRTQALGWGSTEVIVSLAAGLAMLAAFVAVELRARSPLMPMRLFQPKGMRASSVAVTLNGAAFLSMFFLTAIFLQQVRGKSALGTGLELLPMGLAAIVSAVISSTFVTRVGTRTVQLAGGALSVAGLLALSQAGADGSYMTALLPGLVLFGAGLIAIGVPAQIAAVAEVEHRDAGAASAIINSANQIGGALGLAVITTIANSHVTALVHAGLPTRLALAGGFQRGLMFAAVVAAVNLLFVIGAPQIRPDAELVAAAAGA
jgi:EmrB/QacA subfamily drug resistance transporter